MLYIGRSSTNTAVNEVFYSRFKFNFCFLLRSFSAVKVAPVGWQILSASTTTRAIGAKICCYPLIYLSKKPMSLNSTQWHVDSIADIISRYNLGITGRKISYYWLFVFDKGYFILMGWKCMDYKNQILSNICWHYMFHKIYLFGKCDFAFCSLVFW